MNNLSSALASVDSPTQQQLKESAGWARQSLVVAANGRAQGELLRKKEGEIIPMRERVEAECLTLLRRSMVDAREAVVAARKGVK